MKDRKNLDRLFQEQFKDFEEIPPEIVWKNIESQLNKKKKRRVIPLWYKLSGVAALLVFGYLGSRFFFNQTIIEPTNQVVIEENKNENETPNSVVIQKNETNNAASSTDNGLQNEMELKKQSISKEKSVVNRNTNSEKDINKEKHNSKNIINTNTKDNSEIVSNSNSSKKLNSKSNFSDSETSIAETNLKNGKQNESEISKEDSKTNVKSENLITSNKKSFVLEDHNKKIIEKIIDSTAVTALTETNAELNTLGELLKEKEKEQKPKVEPKENKWQITSNIAPVYLGSSSNGSPIDEQFSDNSKDYQNTMSYGVGINYDISKKITLRTGINKVNFEYLTNDVEFFAGFDSREMVTFSSTNSSPQVATIVVQDITNDAITADWKKHGAIEQRMDYYEIPLELSYKILNKKFGIDIIGGMSTLLLNSNDLTVVSDGFSAELGKANNLNSVHFSTNIGLGFRYRLGKSFQANFEPTFKYQLNTFSGNDGGFKPYFFGLYSGVSYRF